MKKSSIINLYHGSYNPNGIQVLREIVADDPSSQARNNTDFGPATYFTNRKEQAAEWSVRRGKNGWLCYFTLDISTLKILNLDPAHVPPLSWIAEILYNRRFTEINTKYRNYIIDSAPRGRMSHVVATTS